VGQEIDVKVLSVDPEQKRISLSLRELESNPWDEILDSFQEGQLIEGTITKLTKFGAFATIKDIEDYEIEGLIHISELSDQRIEHPREVVSEDQTLTLRLIKIDRERRRLGLSLKQVDSAEFTDVDWQTAMQGMEAGAEQESQPEPPVPVEDFDADLEGDIPDLPPVAEAEDVAESEEASAQVEAELESTDEAVAPDLEEEEIEVEMAVDDTQDAELPEAEAELEIEVDSEPEEMIEEVNADEE